MNEASPAKGGRRPGLAARCLGLAAALAIAVAAGCGGDDASLEYVEIVRGVPEPGEPLPLVIGLHGLGDSPENFSRFFSTLPLRGRLVFPRAPESYGDGYSWFSFRAGAGAGAGAEQMAPGIQESGDRVAALIRELQERYPTQGEAIVFGFSQGGYLSFYLAAAHPDLVATAIPISGGLPEPLWPEAAGEPVDVVAFHGTADSLVPITGARAVVTRLRELSIPAQLKEFPGVPHRIPNAMGREISMTILAAAKEQGEPVPTPPL